jgi:hypothetical protein
MATKKKDKLSVDKPEQTTFRKKAPTKSPRTKPGGRKPKKKYVGQGRP